MYCETTYYIFCRVLIFRTLIEKTTKKQAFYNEIKFDFGD